MVVKRRITKDHGHFDLSHTNSFENITLILVDAFNAIHQQVYN